MKLKLPLALAAALVACAAYAQDATEYQHTQIPAGEIPVATSPVTGSADNNYTVKITGDSGSSWHVNATDVTWDSSYNFPDGQPINVGSALTASKLSVVTPEGAEEKTVVNTGANLFIGCPGWGISSSEVYKPQTGEVYVGKDATLNVGYGKGDDTSTTQLNIGAGASYGTYGHEGILIVEGGKVTAGMLNVANGNSDVKGTLIVRDGGTAVAEKRGAGLNTGVLTLGYYKDASGTVIVEGGSTLVAEYYTMVGYGRDGKATGSLTVSEDSTADMGSFLFVGRENGSTGEVTVDDSALTAGTTYLGRNGQGAAGTLTAQNGATATLGNTYLGYSTGTSGTLTVSGVNKDDGQASSLVVQGITGIGYNGGEGAVSLTDGAQASFGSYVMAGGWNGSTGSLTVASGADATVNGYLYLGYEGTSSGSSTVKGVGSELNVKSTACVGYSGTGMMAVSEGGNVTTDGNLGVGVNANSTGIVTVDGADGSLTVKQNTYVGDGGKGTMTISEGASVTTEGYLCLGFGETASGTVNVVGEDSSLNTTGTTYVGYDGKGELNVSSKGQAVLGHVQVNGQGAVSVTNGSTMIAAGDMYVAETATVTVSDGVGADGAAAPSGLGVLGTYTNEGTTVLDLSQGGAFLAGAVENTGDMDVKLDKNGAFSVGSFMNEGDVSITAAEGTTCDLGNMQLRSGSMQLEGAGSFSLGSSASETVFTVTGTSAEAATSTCIDIATLGSTNFEIDTSSEFTFRFTDEIVAALHAAAADATELELTVIKGFEGFQLEQQQLDQLLQNTEYLFGDDAQSVALALEGSSEQYYGIVTNGAYQMKGNDLVWTGTVEVIPEPATATLSLLGLAALAARRRRK